MKPTLTKERLYTEFPDYYGQDLIKRHIDRYVWASGYVNDKDTVLDVACGSGYGTSILAKKGGFVVGADNNEEAIEYADSRYSQSNIQFWWTNLNNYHSIIANDGFYEVIVCIETIEHLQKENADNLLKIFSESLKNNGKLVLTTPNGVLSDGTNEFHIKEYTIDEFKTITEKYFKILEIYPKDNSIFFVAERK